MNAHAHLLSLGWAGPGHSLDSRPNSPGNGTYKQKGHRGLAYDPAKDPLKVGNIGKGLVKPLLISQRRNRFGVGRTAHGPPAGNEWWLKGFESALENIGKNSGESEQSSSGTHTPAADLDGSLAAASAGNQKHGGLYSFFVQGQVMQGTIDADTLNRSKSRKRKSDVFEEDNNKEGPLLNPRPTSPKKPATAEEFQMVGAFMRERDRQAARKAGKTKKASDAEQFAQIGEFFGVVEKKQQQRPKKRKSKVVVVVENGGPRGVEGGGGAPDEEEEEEEMRSETKEERRARRQQRRRDREEQQQQQQRAVTKSEKKKNDSEEEVEIEEDSAAKAARKAERKRRKAERAAARKS